MVHYVRDNAWSRNNLYLHFNHFEMTHTETEHSPLMPTRDPFFWMCVAISIASLGGLTLIILYFNNNPG